MRISEIRKSLKSMVSGQVIWDKNILKFYSVDASSYQIMPKVIVIPKSEKDVIAVIRFANKNKISVTARGAGTGLVGSALNSGIIMDLRNFTTMKILKNSAHVGTGIMKGSLDRTLKEKKKFFPPNPSIGPYCAIGGMIGNNSSGSKTLKYGSTIDNVKQITFVDAKGNKITLPDNKKIGKKILEIAKQIKLDKFPRISKNSCGYRLDLIHTINDTHKVLIGAEGTLGIVLSAKIAIKNIPYKRILFVLEYKSSQEAANDCIQIKKTNPSAIEFVDRNTLEKINFKFTKNTDCLLFVEYDDKLDCLNEFKKINSVKIVKTIKNEKEIEKWWKYRDLALSFSLKSIKIEERVPHIIEDAAVPVRNLAKLFSLIEKINKKFQTRTIMYGHAGNGNIHVRIISSRKKIRSLQKISETYFEEVIKMGGTITGEHGDGIARSEFIEKQYGKRNYLIFKELKKFLDPNNILNPGKIINPKNALKHLEKFEMK